MLPRFIATQAWVERHGLSDADIVWFGNPETDLASAVSAGEGGICPRCRRHPNECEFQAPVPDSATSTPERVNGRAYVECLCGTVYYYEFVYPVDAHASIGEAHVRAASELEPDLAITVHLDGEKYTMSGGGDILSLKVTEALSIKITVRDHEGGQGGSKGENT